MVYIGLDVHQKSTTICIQDQSGKELLLAKCETTLDGFRESLGPWLEKHPGSPAALESCGKAYLVSGMVELLGGRPRVFAAEEAAAKARSRRQKTDGRDAQDLCANLRTGALRREVALPPAAMRQLRAALNARQMYVKQRTMAIQAAKALLREYGAARAQESLETDKGWRAALEQNLPWAVRRLLQKHHESWEGAGKTVRELTELAVTLGECAPAFDVAATVPGIGVIVRLALAAHLFDVGRFASGKALAAYTGLIPSMHDSGERERHGGITKEGPRLLRSLLVEAAQHAARSTSPLNPFYRRWVVKKGHKKAVVAVAHKLCRIVHALVKEGRDFDPARLGVERVEDEKGSFKGYRRAAVVQTAVLAQV